MTLEEKSYIYGLLLTDGSIDIKNYNSYTGTVRLELNYKDKYFSDYKDNLEEIRKAGNKITPEEVKGLPWSDTVVYNKIILLITYILLNII